MNLARSDGGRDFLVMLADRIVRMAVGIIISGLTARYLGAEMFGWLSYAGAFSAVGMAIAQLGFDGIAVRELVRRPDSAGVILGAVMFFRIIAGVVLALILVGIARFIGQGESVQVALIKILALGSLAPALSAPMFWFQARTQSRVALLWGLPSCLVSAGVRWWLIDCGASVESLAWAGLIDMSAGGLLVIWAMYREGGRIETSSVWFTGWKILRESWPLMIGGLAAILYMKLDLIMLKWLAGDSAVGVYAAATRLSEMAYAVPYLAGASYLATLTAQSAIPEVRTSVVEQYFRVSAAVGYLLCLAGGVLAPSFLDLVFGEDFTAAGTVAQVHLVSVLFVCMSVARGRILIIRGWTYFAMASALCGAGANILLNLALIPSLGALGAAIASLISHAIAAIACTLVYPPTRDLGWLQVRALLRPQWRIGV